MNIIKKSESALICSAIAFTAIPMQVQAEADRTIPVYRLYNPNSGEHFYTVNGYERENLIINGWNDEGIGFYESGEGDDVYRVYNPNTGEHHYTINSYERTNLIAHGWKNEGVSFKSDSQHRLTVYRAYNPHAYANNHNYTVSLGEQNVLLSLGWYNENLGWYASAEGDPSALLPGFYHYSLPYYSQLDGRWRYQRFGGYSFGGTGCVPTSLAMVFQGIKGGTILPTDVGTWAHNNSSFDRRNQGSSDAVVPACASAWGVHCDNIQSLDQLTDALKHGKPCVIVVDGGNAFMSGTVAHCVVLHGYNNGSTYVSDPYFSHNCRYWSISYMWSIRTRQSYLLDNSPYYCYALY